MKSNYNSPVILRIDEMIAAMPRGSKRSGVSTFISDFNRVLRLVDKTRLYSQTGSDVGLYSALRYQLYVLKLLRNDYIDKINGLATHHDQLLISYIKNYVFTKIKILETKIKRQKNIALKLGAQ